MKILAVRQNDLDAREQRNRKIKAIFKDIENSVRHYIPDSGDLQIQVSPYPPYGGIGFEAIVRNGEPNSSSTKQAIYWEMQIYLDSNGETHTESNSWSGLNVQKLADITSLRKCADQLEAILKINWAEILNREVPE